MSDLTITFTFRLEMEPHPVMRGEMGSGMVNYFGTPQLIECMWTCVLNLADGPKLRGSDVHLHIVKNYS